jgi:NAD(P)-dependent dehydrogenase (short-subunit alcohol dehydrogenase family)
MIPEEYGGLGLDLTESAIMMTEVAASGAGMSGASRRPARRWRRWRGGRKRWPEEVAGAVVFLASPLASHVNGAVIEMAGGRGI